MPNAIFKIKADDLTDIDLYYVNRLRMRYGEYENGFHIASLDEFGGVKRSLFIPNWAFALVGILMSIAIIIYSSVRILRGD